MENLQYPIGKFEPVEFTNDYKKVCIEIIQSLPQKLYESVQNMNKTQLNTPYRPEGWTVFQLIHHIADSHGQAFYRFKLGLTEDFPIIKPYNEKEWVNTNDVIFSNKELALQSIEITHQRWLILLKNIADNIWESRGVFHPVQNKKMSLWFLLTMYAWHSNHHYAHIKNLIIRNSW